MKVHGCVYVIRNSENAKVYVGATRGQNHRRRFYQFRSAARYPDKLPNMNQLLAQAMRAIGLDRFEIEVLERCACERDLQYAERLWIARLDSLAPNGYNIEGGGVRGRDRGPTGLATGASLRGKPKSPAHRRAISNGMKMRRCAAGLLCA